MNKAVSYVSRKTKSSKKKALDSLELFLQITHPAVQNFNMSWNCTSPPKLAANPDISGIGVLVGFLATAYITLLLCIAHYLIDHNQAINPVDRLVVDGLRKAIKRIKFRNPIWITFSDAWNDVIRDTVLAFSDQQVITSIALLIGGLSQLSDGLSCYHWQNVVNLAWFSSVTHLTTLTTLRLHFHRNHAQRSWRLVSISITAIILLCGACSLGYYDSGIGLLPPEFPAWCLFHHGDWGGNFSAAPDPYNVVYTVITALVLGISYFSRVILLFPLLSARLKERMFTRHAIKMKNWVDAARSPTISPSTKHYFPEVVKEKALHSFFIIWVITTDLVTSMLWEISWLSFVLAWSTIRLMVTRNYIQEEYPDVNLEENVWGFGQVVAVLLLILPLVGVFEAITHTKASRHDPFDTHSNTATLPYTTTPPATPSIGPNPDPHQVNASPVFPVLNSELYSTPWIHRILYLQYGLAIAVLGDFLFFLGFVENAAYLTSASYGDPGFGPIVMGYFVWFLLNLGIVWVFVLLCISTSFKTLIDKILQKAGRLSVGDPPTSGDMTFLWVSAVIVLLGISITFDIFSYTRPLVGEHSNKGEYVE